MATTKKCCNPVEFQLDVSKNGFVFTRVVGQATYYLKDKLKARAKARWNAQEKQWWVWGNALDDAFKKELEKDALDAMPLVRAHDERKFHAQLRETAKAQLIAEGCPFFADYAPGSNPTDEQMAEKGRLMLVAIDGRFKKLLAESSQPASSPASSVSSGASACDFCKSSDASTCPCAVAADAIDAAQLAKA
jgi:hypothetical protein